MDRFVKNLADKRSETRTGDKKIIVERDGALIELYSDFMSANEANELYKELKNLTAWHIGETLTKGGLKNTPRLVMGLINPNVKGELMHYPGNDYPGTGRVSEKVEVFPSTSNSSEVFPGTGNSSEVFTPLLLAAHEKIKLLTGETFNYAYLNYYRDGKDSIGFHSDKEEILEEGSTIASLSLGATRDFVIRHIKDTRLAQDMSDDKLRLKALEAAKQTIPLKSGSLLLMKKQTQKIYHHHVPKRLNVKSPRINITFRHIKDQVV